MADSHNASQLRDYVASRAHGYCEYCRHHESFSTDPFSVEHVVPKCRGGASSADNLAYSCQGCNNIKYTRIAATDPETGQDVALYNPRIDKWSSHFQWDDDALRIVGITSVGRATVDALKLNRQGIVNLRWALFLLGLHPPDTPDAID